jgi:tetratricopeptide (TPR) repeat protein
VWALVRAADLSWRQGDIARAKELSDESLNFFRELGDTGGSAFASMVLGHVAADQHNYGLAATHFEESLALNRQIGDRHFIAWALADLAEMAMRQADRARAVALYEQSLLLFRELGHTWSISFVLLTLAEVTQSQGDYSRAMQLYAEGLGHALDVRNLRGVAWCFKGLAELAEATGQAERAAWLGGASVGVLESSDEQLEHASDAEYWPDIVALRTRLEAAGLAAAWADGRAMTLEQAVAYALEETI